MKTWEMPEVMELNINETSCPCVPENPCSHYNPCDCGCQRCEYRPGQKPSVNDPS